MTEDKFRRTQNVEFSQDQKHDADDEHGEACHPDFDEITISDEAIERSMRVYSPDEAMDLLICDAPGRSASTERWQDFLERMRAAPPTRATQRGIAEALRELAGRVPAGRC